jgi:YbbR domain-containing protein
MARVWPFRHVGLKIVSIVIAVFIWLIVAGEQTVERSLRVPLQFQEYPPGVEMVGEPPSAVDVRIRGAAGIVSRMTGGEMAAVLDLRAAGAGRRVFQITPENVQVPFGVEVVQVVPATVAIEFEPSTTREVPVVPLVEGQPADGFEIGAITSEPPTVEVVGPASAVAEVDEALTETVNVSGATETVTANVTLGFTDPSLRLKTPGRARVTVAIEPAVPRTP